jgi:hypothetical protein
MTPDGTQGQQNPAVDGLRSRPCYTAVRDELILLCDDSCCVSSLKLDGRSELETLEAMNASESPFPKRPNRRVDGETALGRSPGFRHCQEDLPTPARITRKNRGEDTGDCGEPQEADDY